MRTILILRTYTSKAFTLSSLFVHIFLYFLKTCPLQSRCRSTLSTRFVLKIYSRLLLFVSIWILSSLNVIMCINLFFVEVLQLNKKKWRLVKKAPVSRPKRINKWKGIESKKKQSFRLRNLMKFRKKTIPIASLTRSFNPLSPLNKIIVIANYYSRCANS